MCLQRRLTPPQIQCCVSTRQLQRFIRERMASSPHHWLRRMRMEQAVSLLRQQTPRKQIAAEMLRFVN